MPLTPLHIGPHAAVSLPLNRWLDIPVFVGINAAMGIESLLVAIFNLNYPLHGYSHTLLIGSLVGILLATVWYPFRPIIGKVMKLFGLPYAPTFVKMVLSGVLGAWLHVLLDAPLYADIRPFYPFQANPLYGCVSMNAVYGFCAACFVVAFIIYIWVVFAEKRRNAEAS
jgi:membrane-bound metal-dependent hydrolase YbcI (DUF457 family)